MADDGKSLVSKWILDSSSWADTVAKAKSTLSEFASASKASADQDKAASAEAVAGLSKQVEVVKQVGASKTEASKAAVAGASEELAAIEKVNVAQAKQNEILLKQIVVLKERAEASKKGKESSGGKGDEELIEARLKRSNVTKIASTLLGSGASNLLVSAVAGTATVAVLEQITEGFEKLADGIKEAITESGQLAQLKNTLDGLAGSGADEFLDKMRTATHGLVSDTNILKTSIAALSNSGLKASKNDVVQLTTEVVSLARSSGNTATQAMQALATSFKTGRFAALGAVTGITDFNRQIHVMSSNMDLATRQSTEFARAQQAIQKRYENIAKPLDTYSDRLTQLHVVQDRLKEGFAEGFTQSAGFSGFLEQLGGVIEKLGGLEEVAKKAGEALGAVFGTSSALTSQFPQILAAVVKLFQDLGKAVSEVGAAFGSKGYTDAQNQFEAIHPVLALSIKLFAYMGGAIRQAAADLDFFAKLYTRVGNNIATGSKQIYQSMTGPNRLTPNLSQLGSGLSSVLAGDRQGPGGADQLEAELKSTTQNIQKSVDAQIQSSETSISSNENKPKATGEGKTPPKPTDPDFARRQALAIAKANMQLKEQLAQEALDKQKQLLASEQEANESMYKQGTESAEAYYGNKIFYAQKAYESSVALIKQEAQAQKDELKVQLQQGALPGGKEVYNIKSRGIDSASQAKMDVAATTRQKDIAGDTLAYQQQINQGIVANINAGTQAQKKGSEIQAQIVQKQFEEGMISGDRYTQTRINQINLETQAEIDAQDKIAALSSEDLRVAEATANKKVEIVKEGLLQIQKLQDEGLDNQLKSVNQQYGNKLSYNQAQQGIASATGSAGGQSAFQLQSAQTGLLQDQITALEKLQTQAQQYSQTWYEISLAIAKAQQELIEHQNTMAEQNSPGGIASGFLGSIASAGSSIFKGSFGQGFISSLGAGAASLAASGKITATPGATNNIGGTGDDDLFSALKTSIGNISDGESGSFLQLGKTLSTAATAIGSFASVIANAQSPLAGAFGGAQSGGGLGAAVGSGMGPLGSLFGGLAGAAGGAILGLISGQKNQQIHQNIVDMQKAALSLNAAFSSGTQSLNGTITAMQSMIATLTMQMNSSKKGSSQYQQLIQQYNQQLLQLQAQVAQTMQQLQVSLDSVSQPQAYQQWISQISQVVQQYSQFAGAAQNATQLAQANQFLVQSLQGISQTMGDTLLSDEETQIQNAISLNDLYNQRNQLELQYLNQVQGIMSQGNVTRQRTQAQSAYSQLYDAQVNYAQQLDQINQQIALSQYQVTAAQQVFNLATTRIGLENQLLGLQEQGVNEDMQRIGAMQQLLATLSSSGYSITNLSSLNASDPNSVVNQLLTSLNTQLGTGQNTMIEQLNDLISILSAGGGFSGAGGVPAVSGLPSSTNAATADTIFTAAYQSRAAFAYGLFRGATF